MNGSFQNKEPLRNLIRTKTFSVALVHCDLLVKTVQPLSALLPSRSPNRPPLLHSPLFLLPRSAWTERRRRAAAPSSPKVACPSLAAATPRPCATAASSRPSASAAGLARDTRAQTGAHRAETPTPPSQAGSQRSGVINQTTGSHPRRTSVVTDENTLIPKFQSFSRVLL